MASSPHSGADRWRASYEYTLPPERIAQTPVSPRDRARLLVVGARSHAHATVRDLPEWLQAGDLLVLNNTRVLPARLHGRKPTGAEVEVLLLEASSSGCWLALVKPGKRVRPGTRLRFDPLQSGGQPLEATAIDRDAETGGRWLRFELPAGCALESLLPHYGRMPLPPYIADTQSAREQYQTAYARSPGAVAAPTAGLHLTDELLQRLQQCGIGIAELTLHVGLGTFRPVEAAEIGAHRMHREWLAVPAATAERVARTRAAGGRVIAVGTTVVRALEGAFWARGELGAFEGQTNLFIYPGYRPQVVDGLMTNFHLPGSSLLMMVSAFLGRERLLALYRAAITARYRFYSFGDAMLITPAAVVA
ncbi:MAG: tRNA preQ1(34) S-adenosylmethionine ribosyltransferase-isomerase QueA [Cyanobacteria bacterium QS_8_64_29]|nr:MAG: tRNA preQ1(34) S-adenosylmethionine ribosyltransferase-isomerase QueA [Cyanobacteria bacterium QS_8_64_29]